MTKEVTEHALGVPRAYAAFAVPLGATTKMDVAGQVLVPTIVAKRAGILDLERFRGDAGRLPEPA